MMSKSSEKPLESYTSSKVLVFSAGLAAISFSLNNIGFRLDKILDAYSEKIVRQMEIEQSCKLQFDERLKKVELMAHKSKDIDPR